MQSEIFIVVLDLCCYVSINEGSIEWGSFCFEVDIKPSRLPSEKQ